MRKSRNVAALLALLCACSPYSPLSAQPGGITVDQVDRWMTELSNWGRWGKEDQRGTLNLMTPAVRRGALKLVKDGVAVSLAHTIEKEPAADNPRPLGQQMTLDTGGHAMDLYTIWYHGSVITHIDSLCHYSFQGKIYNGFDRARIAQGPGCVQNGVENQKDGIMTRGILVDMPLLKNVPYLEPGTAVTAADLEAWEKFAGIKVRSGDALFLRTGRWAQRAQKGPWNVAASAAGFHASVLPWLKQRDVALLGNDAVTDVQPSGIQGSPRPIHQIAIVAMGLPLVDVMDLEAVAREAAARKRWDFLLTAAPVPVLGEQGSPSTRLLRSEKGAWCRVLGAGCWVLGAGCWVLGAGQRDNANQSTDWQLAISN